MTLDAILLVIIAGVLCYIAYLLEKIVANTAERKITVLGVKGVKGPPPRPPESRNPLTKVKA